MKNMTLQDLFLMKIKALYDIETQLLKVLPKMVKNAEDEQLQQAFIEHLTETEDHVMRLEEIFGMLGQKPSKTKVEGIRGLVADGEWVIKNVKPESALDANLIAAAQYVEHYEMAGYGTAIEWAKLLNLLDAAELLELTLEEEKAADEKLNSLATDGINQRVDNAEVVETEKEE